MCFSNDCLLSAEEYRRAIEVVGILNGRGVKVLSVMFSLGCDFDVLVAANSAVETLPNAVCFAIIRQKEVWQTNVCGVRVRWIKPRQQPVKNDTEQPQHEQLETTPQHTHAPLPDHGIWARIWSFLGLDNAD